MTQINLAPHRLMLLNLFNTHKTTDGVSVTELVKLCKNTKIIPVSSKQDFISIQELNLILCKLLFKPFPHKISLNFNDFEMVITEIASSMFQFSLANDKLLFLVKAISKQCENVYNFRLENLKNSASGTQLNLRKKKHTNSLSGRTLVPKRSVKNLVYEDVTHRVSNSTASVKNNESNIRVLKSYRSSAYCSKIGTGKNTRASSIDLNINNILKKSKEKYQEKLEKAKVLIKKLKKSEFIKPEPCKSIEKKVKYLEHCRSHMFPDHFVIKLILKSWQNYTILQKNLKSI